MPEIKPGHWESLLASFNPRFYARIARQGFGRSFVYILLLSFVLSLLFSAKYTLAFIRLAPQVKKMALEFSAAWPKELAEIKIENGQVSSPVAQPFFHKVGKFDFILDTTGRIKSPEGYSQALLLTRNKLIFKTKKSEEVSETREYSLSKIESFTLKPGNSKEGIIARITTKEKAFNLGMDTLKSLLRVFFIISLLLLLAAIPVYYLSAKIIQGLISAVLAWPVNKIFKAGLTYANLLNIALYALTPATLVSAVLVLSGARVVSLSWFLYCGLSGAYLILGIRQAGAATTIKE